MSQGRRDVLLTDDQVCTLRKILQIVVRGKRFTVRRCILEALDRFYDSRAGRWALTEEEQQIRRVLRDRFGLYDPTSEWQARLIDAMRRRAA